jgi:hypothetical protein
VIKDDNIISNVRLDKNFTTNEEIDIINEFDYKIFTETQINLNSRNLNYNSININNNQDKIHYEKIEKNSSIFNNEILANNASNNDFAFIKNSNSFPYGPGVSNNNNTIKGNSLNNKNKIKNDNYNNNNYHNPNFDFFKIFIKKLKIIIFKKADFIIISFFSSLTKTCIIKNYLLHVYIVYSNFFFDSFENSRVKKFSEGIALMAKNFNPLNKSKNIIKNKDLKSKNYTNTQSSVPQVGTETRNINNIINNFENNKYNIQNSKLNQNNINRTMTSNNDNLNQNQNQNHNDNIDYKEKSIFFKLMRNIFFEVKNILFLLNLSKKNKINKIK